jgi:O-antigen/teichoic acid export membrane protein
VTTRLRHGALLSLPGTLIPGVAAYAAFVAVKRVDSATTLGYLSLAWVITNIGSAIVALGPSHTALRSIAGDVAGIEGAVDRAGVRVRFRGMVLRRSLIVGAAMLGAAAVTLPLSHRLAAVIALSLPWVVGQSLVLYETETLKAGHRFGAASTVLAGRAVIGWAAAVWGAWAIGGLAATILPTAIVGLAFAAVLSGGRVGRITDDEQHIARTVGRPIGQLSVASYALGYGDRFVVQAFLGPIAVAIYTLGYQLGEGAMELVTQPITSAALPKVVGTWQAGPTGRAEAEALSRRIAVAFLGLAVLAPVVVFLLRSTGIFHLVSGDHRFPAIVAITGAAVGLQGITRIGYGLLLAQGRTQAALRNFVAVGLICAVVAPLLTWRWGLVGTAWATFIGYSTLVVATVRSVRQVPPDPVAVTVAEVAG